MTRHEKLVLEAAVRWHEVLTKHCSGKSQPVLRAELDLMKAVRAMISEADKPVAEPKNWVRAVPASRVYRAKLPPTDKSRLLVAKLYMCGFTQPQVGAMFGYANGTQVSLLITQLIAFYCPEHSEGGRRVYSDRTGLRIIGFTGEDRKRLIREAINRCESARNRGSEMNYVGASVDARQRRGGMLR